MNWFLLGGVRYRSFALWLTPFRTPQYCLVWRNRAVGRTLLAPASILALEVGVRHFAFIAVLTFLGLFGLPIAGTAIAAVLGNIANACLWILLVTVAVYAAVLLALRQSLSSEAFRSSRAAKEEP